MPDRFRDKLVRFAARHYETTFFLAILLAELVLVVLTLFALTIGMISSYVAYFIISLVVSVDIATAIAYILE